jgi:hypothetical protein
MPSARHVSAVFFTATIPEWKQFRRLLVLVCLLLAFSQCSCFLSAGTHGSIKSYQYPVPKQKLQAAVEKVIAAGGSVRRDTVRKFIVNVTNGRRDTIDDNYYNDTVNYVTIYIHRQDVLNTYTFHYYGDKEFWDTSKTSVLSIAYAWNRDGKGGSEGNGDVTWFTPLLRKSLTKVFEQEFISKVDKELGVAYAEE